MEILRVTATVDKSVFDGLLWIMESAEQGVNRRAIGGFVVDVREPLFFEMALALGGTTHSNFPPVLPRF
jgi:hypothetical protein